ncbi:FAD-dependent oxidoreductase [Mycobacterium sp. 236(2023)]|uniref:NAD(P)/FAD-dependent oxidoreductase n=1 Tax=Mycobacterium sp. 236(2023) TaxID=3038163 RepID=UPI002414DD3F|nr:FAD-dependent oxidoreductase [Mycobacterium sp. 236(2023)]MDG4666764.1 FAD-dependent oxidoreductase [Mycobacterium sp. 236(2023)]
MQTVVVGAGPTGLFTAIALARRKQEVLVVDRDPGPAPDGGWQRRGVMQFEHAHSFRGPVVDALHAEIPDAVGLLETSGATVVSDPHGSPIVLHARRALFERVLRRIASRQRGLTVATSNVRAVRRDRGRGVGIDTTTSHISADLVIDASGRASRFSREFRGTGEGAPCGAAYVSRQYRLTADPGPLNSPVGLSLSLAGYFAVVFLHDNRTFSIVVAHDGTDPRMRRLRDSAVFEAAARAIPLVAEWIEPERATPLTPVLLGGQLYNSYHPQTKGRGDPLLPGLVRVGDSVCTTTPLAGRGVALAFRQAQALVDAVTRHPRDHVSATAEFDQWCDVHLRPWFVDHMHCDTERLRRWSGGDVDLTRPLPSDLVVAAAQADPALRDAAAPYERMAALPDSLDRLQDRAAAVYAAGWRPPVASGATRDELGELCCDAQTARGQWATGQPCPV